MSNGPEGFAFPPLREPGTLGKPRHRVKPASGLGGEREAVFVVARASRTYSPRWFGADEPGPGVTNPWLIRSPVNASAVCRSHAPNSCRNSSASDSAQSLSFFKELR